MTKDIKNGSIYWVNLKGYKERFKQRPCVVVSNDKLCKYSNNVLVIMATTNTKKGKNYPEDMNLNIDGKPARITTTQIFTVSKSQIKNHIQDLTQSQKKTLKSKIVHTLSL